MKCYGSILKEEPFESEIDASEPAENIIKELEIRQILDAAKHLSCYDDDYVAVEIENSKSGISFIQAVNDYDFGKLHLYITEIFISEETEEGPETAIYRKEMEKDAMVQVFEQVLREDKVPADFDTWEDVTEQVLESCDNPEKEKEVKQNGKIITNYLLNGINRPSEEELFPEYWETVKECAGYNNNLYSLLIADTLNKYGKYREIMDLFNEYPYNQEFALAAGDVAYYGYLGEPDYKRAFEMYDFADRRGHLNARLKLAHMYRDGLGVEKDYAKYVELVNSICEDIKQCGRDMFGDGDDDYDVIENDADDAPGNDNDDTMDNGGDHGNDLNNADDLDNGSDTDDEYTDDSDSGYDRAADVLLPCVDRAVLEKAQIEEAEGRTEAAIKTIVTLRDRLEHTWGSSAEVTDTDAEVAQYMYTLVPFDPSEMKLSDVLYVMQKPCRVRIIIDGKQYEAEAVDDNGVVIVCFGGKYYRDAKTFLNKAEIDGRPLRTYIHECDLVEIVA